MHIKILRNCFHAAFVIIVMLCFCGNVFGTPIIYSDTSIHQYVSVYGSGAGGFDYQIEHHVGPGTATKTISEIGYYYTQATATGDIESFSLHGECIEYTEGYTSTEAMPYVVEGYTFIAPSSEVIFTYDISLTEIHDESPTSRESWALMSWYIREAGETFSFESEQYNIYTPEDIMRSFALTLTVGEEYFLHLSPHLYLSTTYSVGDATPLKNQIAGRFEGSFTLETSENNPLVPEPSSLLLLAFGIAGLVGLVGIRKKF